MKVRHEVDLDEDEVRLALDAYMPLWKYGRYLDVEHVRPAYVAYIRANLKLEPPDNIAFTAVRDSYIGPIKVEWWT